MINVSKNIVLYSLLILFVVSTSGINIFIHHCACHGEEQVSLFVEEDCLSCKEESELQICCDHDSDAVSEKNTEIHESCCSVHEDCKNHSEDHSFCNTTQRFYQIADDFVDVSTEKVPQPLRLSLFIISNYLSATDTEKVIPSPQYESGPPIGLQKDGLDLILFFNCLKIPTYSC